MKDRMIDEKLNEKLNEENLEEVTGGFNTQHLHVGGYADSPAAMHAVMTDDTNFKNVSPIINGNDKPKATHAIKTGMFGKPVLVDLNDEDKANGGNPTFA